MAQYTSIDPDGAGTAWLAPGGTAALRDDGIPGAAALRGGTARSVVAGGAGCAAARTKGAAPASAARVTDPKSPGATGTAGATVPGGGGSADADPSESARGVEGGASGVIDAVAVDPDTTVTGGTREAERIAERSHPAPIAPAATIASVVALQNATRRGGAAGWPADRSHAGRLSAGSALLGGSPPALA
jgi:hypothetical protein